MLPNAHRLKRRQDFSTVYHKGSRSHSSHLTLRALRRTATAGLSPATRTGISISLKVSKRAVIRNRIKRQLRACLRQLLPEIAPGWDVVIVVHPPAIGCGYSQFLQELKQLLIDAEVIHGHS